MVNEINTYVKEYVHFSQEPQLETPLITGSMEKTAATWEDDSVPFKQRGQVLKNLEETRTDKHYTNNKYYDVSNSNYFSLILLYQDPKFKPWIQRATHYKSSVSRH